jgi:hypothetical protein
MNKKKNPSNLQKLLLSIFRTSVTIGLLFTPISAHAFSLTLTTFGSPRTFRDTNNDHKIFFSQTIPNQLSIQGWLIRDKGSYDAVETGSSVNGTVLNLTGLRVTNLSNRPLSLNNLINFESEFLRSYPNGIAFADQLLDGNFNGGSGNSVNLTGRVGTVQLATLSSSPNQFRFLRSSDPQRIQVGNTQQVRGRLAPLNLASGKRLILPDSACISVLDREVTDNDTRRICDRAAGVPEPTSVISLLAFGVFGGGFLLKRQRKSSDS